MPSTMQSLATTTLRGLRDSWRRVLSGLSMLSSTKHLATSSSPLGESGWPGPFALNKARKGTGTAVAMGRSCLAFRSPRRLQAGLDQSCLTVYPSRTLRNSAERVCGNGNLESLGLFVAHFLETKPNLRMAWTRRALRGLAKHGPDPW